MARQQLCITHAFEVPRNAYRQSLFTSKEKVRSSLSPIVTFALVALFVLGLLLPALSIQPAFARPARQSSPRAGAISAQQAATSPIWYFA